LKGGSYTYNAFRKRGSERSSIKKREQRELGIKKGREGD